MKYKMAIIVLTASLASALVIGCGSYQASSDGKNAETYSFDVLDDASKDSIYSIDQTFSNVDILTEIADITVQKGSPSQVEVHLSDEYYFDLQTKDDTLYLTEKQDIPWWRHFIHVNFGSSKNSVIVTLEQDQWDDFVAVSDTGSIYIEDQNADTFTIDSDTGNIELNHCQATALHTNNDTGATILTNISADVSSESDTGNIHISNGNLTNLKAESDTGSVHVAQTTLDNINVKTDTGKIEVEAGGSKNDYNYDFNFDTGHIELAQDKYSSGTYQISNNASKNMTLRSDTGSCSIQFFQPDDRQGKN